MSLAGRRIIMLMDVYSDAMEWPYGGSQAHEKANRFIEGSPVESTMN